MSSLRAAGDGEFELRLVEQDGKAATAQVKLDLPVTKAAPCDLLGRPLEEYRPMDKGVLNAALGPWQVKTFRLK